MSEDDITQPTHPSQTPSRLDGQVATGDYSLDSARQNASEAELTKIEEFSVLGFLGKGGFGTVYRAYDGLLQREVALKVPHQRLVNQSDLAAAYLREARAMASLDHPHIVPVYRAAATQQVACYLVTKLIHGCPFGQWIRRKRPSYRQLADVLRYVADALAYAHSRGIVHRDIKPGNILIDEEDCPYVVDFGLALRDVEREGRSAYVGTPAYMSPEQARGEGHRVDGRSDIFSLGTVLYQSLTDSKPFKGEDRDSLFQEIIYHDPVDPREIQPEVPAELARICLKSLSKSVHDRYASCELLVDDLAHFVETMDGDSSTSTTSAQSAFGPNAAQADSHRQRRTLPKGLRPFDLRDAEHYLELLPGPYDRDGLPDIVRFWLSRIDSTDASRAVPVGLIYGPSGCGKTSLVRAGIMSRLGNPCTSIYLQATPESTESVLAGAIRSKFGDHRFGSVTDLADLIAALRRGNQPKVVIFIDQFEQWLFSHPDIERESLTAALRQCDGVQVQCILMVRDDFWLGISRLMQAIDLPIAENENATLLDLFDTRHARHVLALFGAAHERLPDSQTHFSPRQNQFLDSAIRYLASDGRVICVQLALLTEMLKHRNWETSSSLFKDGGTGIGVRFLDETFDNERSPRRIRLFAEGAEHVLRALLPESGSSIKGAVRSEQELMEATGYRDKAAFRRLIAVLDGELHLITPTDRTEEDSFSSESSTSQIGTTGYQLTHDFLIAPIRHWVELRNRTTKAGKARLRLDEFTELYRARPLPQALPTLSEYLAVRRHVPPSTYTGPQLRMMNAARQRHLGRLGAWSLAVGLLLAVSWGGYAFVVNQLRQRDSQAALTRLVDAELSEAIPLATELREDAWIRAQASTLVADPDSRLSVRVRASLVNADRDVVAAETLTRHALTAPVDEVVQIARSIVPLMNSTNELAVELWRDQTATRGELLRAACLIANDPGSIGGFDDPDDQAVLVQLLLAENPVWSKSWGLGFAPLAETLLPRLAKHLSDPDRQQPSLTAVNLVRQFAKTDFHLLADLVRSAHASEFNLLLETMEADPDRARDALRRQWDQINQAETAVVDVTRPWGSPWWIVGDRDRVDLTPDPVIDDALLVQLDSFQSVIGPHAIVAHQVPRDRLAGLATELAISGYRIGHLAVYRHDAQRYCFVLFTRDSLESKYALDLSADQVRALNRDHRDEGFLPDSISGYADEDKTLRYFVSWIRRPQNNGVTAADLYLEVPGSHHQTDGWQPMLQRGLSLPRFNLSVQQSDLPEQFTSIRWQTTREIRYADAWNQSADQCRQIIQWNRSSPVLVAGSSLATDGRRDGTVTPVWWHDLPVQAKLLEHQGRLDHLRAAGKLMAEGYFPVSLDAAAFDDDRTFRFQSVWWRALPEIDAQVASARVRCNLALAQLRLQQDQNVKDALAGHWGEETRGAVIAGFGEFMLPPEWLFDQIQNSRDDQAPQDAMRVRSCLMALKLIPVDQVSPQQRSSVTEVWRDPLQRTTDSGIRSASLALAAAWNLDLPLPPSSDPDREFLAVSGQRMVVVRPAATVWLGSYGNEPGRDGQKEPRTAFVIDHDYAIGATEVTVEQFLAFRNDFDYPEDYARSVDSPAINVTWYDAAKYCRWLSEQEGIPEDEMCYPEIDAIKPGMVVSAGSVDRIGYRLATEAEWESACRGGVDRNRWFGFDPKRLDDHAWTVSNSEFRTQPVARLLPNDYGLFDMLGNVMEWCHSQSLAYPRQSLAPASDPGNEWFDVEGRTRMITRGGAMLYQPGDARASQRNLHGADSRWVYMGFRIARTIRPTLE
ncbi:Serine/threonine-protein kinase PknB [Stieleria neptunia]|uniref:Serine/threonine-protein kinase PknB n=1 Tax=Stieleria neptunia TaxID=2527979 RepID=A0A518I4A0_9BACT|nr:SUMF1/EgtB/PvdO family nonheme iron enzyme [Stieleria neptunia]QDV47896.1 Serine/threonine-protein kinase PknB [Stieleria neptunia]